MQPSPGVSEISAFSEGFSMFFCVFSWEYSPFSDAAIVATPVELAAEPGVAGLAEDATVPESPPGLVVAEAASRAPSEVPSERKHQSVSWFFSLDIVSKHFEI